MEDAVSTKRPRSADSSGGVFADARDKDRYFVNELDDSRDPTDCDRRLQAAVASARKKLQLASHKKASIYTGECGFYFALLRSEPSLRGAGRTELLQQIQRALQHAEVGFDQHRVTFLEGLPGNLALQADVCHRLGDDSGVQSLIARIGAFSSNVSFLLPGECEVLYGRCGYLGAILHVRRLKGDRTILKEIATSIISEILDAGRQSARTHPDWPLYYEWHGKCYFGGAHGFAGIIFTLLQFPDELMLYPDGSKLVRRTADVLLEHRFPSGNMPSSQGSDKDRLVHWCHGAAGFVPLLGRLYSLFKEPKYYALAQQMGEVLWKRGLLSTKGPGLCHGIPGNGYCFFVLQRMANPGDERWLRRARHFAVVAAENASKLAVLCDRPFSLFEGLAGAFAFWQDVLSANERSDEVARFPAYEF